MNKSLYPAKPQKKVNWSFVLIATGLTCFFGVLVALMLAGFKGVESGYTYNGGLLLCMLATL